MLLMIRKTLVNIIMSVLCFKCILSENILIIPKPEFSFNHNYGTVIVCAIAENAKLADRYTVQ